MEGTIDFRGADSLERKFALAFLKGLASIKYRDILKKAEAEKQKGKNENAEPEPEIDVGFLYENLFNPQEVSPDAFNKLVDNGMRLIHEVVNQNMNKETLDGFLAIKVQAKEEAKKAVSLWWKQEQQTIMAAIRGPTASETEGIADIDW